MACNFEIIKKDVIKIDLNNHGDKITITQPSNIIAFKSDDPNNNRTDSFILKKKKRISNIRGISTIFLRSSNNAPIKVLQLSQSAKGYIFLKNILAHTTDVKLNLELSKISNSIFTQKYIHYNCSGIGTIVYYGEGESINISLQKNEKIYIPTSMIIAFSKEISFEIKTYGNLVAVTAMDFQYKFTGPGEVVLQTQSLAEDIRLIQEEAGLLNRVLQDIVPFGTTLFGK